MRIGKTKIAYIIGALAVLAVVVPLVWGGVETTIEATSRPEFCGSCHVMEPMVAAYHASVHGGNNPYGVAARCTDCHTSHTNAFSYLASKTRSGFIDTAVTWTSNEFALDWQANRARRAEYVYDSGCLQCHANLKDIPAGHDAHAKYLAGTINAKCVDCHEGVGHEGLNKYLLEAKYKYGH